MLVAGNIHGHVKQKQLIWSNSQYFDPLNVITNIRKNLKIFKQGIPPDKGQ